VFSRKKTITIPPAIARWDGERFVVSKEVRNKKSSIFRIVCVYGDWSGYSDWETCRSRMDNIERDYGGQRPRGYFQVLEG
jgi:hypothetical protein